MLSISATWRYFEPPSLLSNTWFLKQSLWAGVGLLVLLGAAAVHPRVLRSLAYPIYGVAIASLVVVLLAGRAGAAYGAERWVEVGGLPLQPAEAAKIALIIALARAFANNPPGPRLLLLTGGLALLPAALIYLQPSLGTSASLVAIWFGVLLLSGAPLRYALGVLGAAIVAAPLVWLGMKDYMRERVLIFLDPRADALGQGYNILQAQISVGSGGMWGKGLFEGTQTQLRYLRVSHSDFIFSVLGEELGFIGAMALFALLILLLVRTLRAYEVADDRFASLVCAGVASMVAFQAIANLGANIGLIPVTGVPLPFLSYGGSALVSQFVALGLVEATLLRRRLYRFEI
jgi:rod shape determining protein RodA